MLRTLTLKNFRKHEDAEFNFTDGLVVVRGANEAGKSTLGEAVLYALFGSSMLRESLDAVVTYDKPESSLKVALTFAIDGVDYKIVRGKIQLEPKEDIKKRLNRSPDEGDTVVLAWRAAQALGVPIALDW